MHKINQWMIAAILLICGMVVVTSCGNKDNGSPTVEDGPGPLAEKLVGTWYAIYDAEGSANDEGSGQSAVYDGVIDIYNFVQDGYGSFIRCFFGENKKRPVVVQGILGYGKFSYTSRANGKVSMTLVNDWGQAYPQKWDINYGGETMAAKGVDGQALELVQADEVMKEVLSKMVDRNGATPTYDVNKYKPKDVDNSQWMKPLADDRLVADLSLPGSHDACTAEGWQGGFLSMIYEMTAKCQDLTIAEQLKVGVRVFDLRPERTYADDGYELRCSHGVATTKMLVVDFFRTLKKFLADNPTEFCVLTVDISATSDVEAWKKEFHALLKDSEFEGLFSEFKPRLTVGEMRGHVLILSRMEYAEKPIGGFCYGWVYDLEFEKQTKGHITGSDGTQTPLWVQDYWGQPTRDGKDEALVRMLEAAVARDMTVERPAWVINYSSAYFSLPLSDSYRDNATYANVVAANWLESHDGPVGIIYMDFSGMDKSVSFSEEVLYETAGLRLVDQLIKQNAVGK